MVLKLSLDVHTIYKWFQIRYSFEMSSCPYVIFPHAHLWFISMATHSLISNSGQYMFYFHILKNPRLQDPSMMHGICFTTKGSILVCIMLPSFCMGVLVIATRSHVVQVWYFSTFKDTKNMIFTTGNFTVTDEHANNIRKWWQISTMHLHPKRRHFYWQRLK